MKQEQIDRINELYHKSQSVGLTDEEKEEQAALRKQYFADIKASLRGRYGADPYLTNMLAGGEWQ